MAEINFSKVRSELIKIYGFFLKNPQDKKISYLTAKYDSVYGGLTSYNKVLANSPIPKDIERALSGLSTIYQYGMWSSEHSFSNENIVKVAKKVLKDLEKEDK